MDEKLNRSNRLPGSEKLTRPEEIGQLSKYLKKIKESYEESTRLEDQLVGVAGYSTGKIPEITKLGDKMIGTPGKRDEVGLTKKVLGIPDNTKENKLRETRLTLTDSRENKLRDSVIEKPENVGEEVDRLSSVIKKIEDVRDQQLENKRVGLEDGREIKLGNTRLDLQAMINASLENKRVRLELKNEDPKLEDTKLNISDQREHKLGDKVIGLDNIQSDIKLEETRLDIQDARVDSLEDKRIGLEDAPKITKLEDTRLMITDPRENKLGEKKVEIEDKREIGLGNKRVELGDVENVDKLGNKRIGIEDSRENKLEETRLDLTDSRNIELGNKKENLWDDRNLSLPNTRLDIYDSWKGELENKQEKLWDDREPKLPNTRKNLYDDRNIELGDKRENLWDDRNPELSNTRKDLKDDRNINLPDSRLNLKDDRNIGLPNTRLDIKDDWKGELGDKRIELQDDRELELPDTRLDLEDEREGELEDKRLDLTDDREYELGSSAIGLSPNQSVMGEDEVGLSDYVARLTDDREPSLSDKLLNLIDDREIGLGNKRINLTDDRDIGLEDKRLDLEDGRENELEDKRLDLTDDRENKLEDKILELTDDREPELGDKKIELEDDREPSLSDKILELEDNREPELETNIHILPSSDQYGGSPEELYDQVIEAPENENGEVEELYDQVIEAHENENDEVSELSDKIIEGLKNENDEVGELETNIHILPVSDQYEGPPEDLSDKVVEGLKNEHDEVDELETNIHILPSSDQDTSNLSDNELYELAMKLASEGQNGSGDPSGWLQKVEGLMSTYLSSPILSPKRAIEFRDAINNSLEMSYFGSLTGIEYRQNNREGDGSRDSSYVYTTKDGKPLNIGEKSKPIAFPDSQSETIKDGDVESLRPNFLRVPIDTSYGDVESLKPNFLRVPIDTSCGTTWAKAEDAIGDQITGTNRRDALDQMIVKLVDYGKVSLPGSSLNPKDAIKDAVGNLKSGALITGDIKHPSPMNKPLNLSGLAIPGGAGDSVYQAANSRTNLDTLDPIGDTVGTTFYDRYWNSSSFKTTLEELCPTVGKAPISSLAELKALLKASPYFTSPGKFMTDTTGSYNTKTLDTNMYWEVVIEPFCSDSGSCSNGNYSFLPSIQEINYINKELHKVSTSYGFWAPINSFELQKSKLITKSLPLYEGEISYPTGMDFTNELRLTFVDDSWKSWKRYFERCAEVAVYNSESHNKDFYSKKISSLGDLTKIDKTHFCVSSYKNITFNVRIYILNPQLNLLNKYSLLCVLKDYAEEYVGEIDSGGSDLSVTFSIVGENPEEDVSLGFTDTTKYIIKELAKQVALETQKRVTGVINSSIGLI